MSFARYPSYIKSNVAWSPTVPATWKVLPTKRGFIRRKEVNSGMKCENRLSLTLNGVLPRSLDDLDGLQASEFETYQIFQRDDLVFKLIDLQNIKTSRVGLVHEEGIMSPAYIRLEPIQNKIFPSFAYWFFTDLYKREVFNKLGEGVRQTLGAEDLLVIPFFFPSIEEQKSISIFLNYETSKIDKLILEQESLIDLLKEKRQAVISNAVTKGIDPKAKMKESEVEWLGKVPQHWDVKKLKFVVDVMASNVDKKTIDGDVPCLLCNYTDVYYNEQIKEDMEFMSATATPEQIKKFTLKQGDVIITKDSESPDDIAIAAYVPMDLIGVVCGYHLSIIRATKINGMFVKRLFDSNYLKSKFATLANGLTRYGLGQHSINNVYIPIPPDEEQQQIVEFINKTCNEIDDLINKSKIAINLLAERRSALISESVTGQIDVRNYQIKEVA